MHKLKIKGYHGCSSCVAAVFLGFAERRSCFRVFVVGFYNFCSVWGLLWAGFRLVRPTSLIIPILFLIVLRSANTNFILVYLSIYTILFGCR